MKRACLSIFAVFSLVITSQPVVCQSQSSTGTQPTSGGVTQCTSTVDRNAENVRSAVEKIGIGRKITVFLANGDVFHGTIAKIELNEFQIAEVDMQRTLTIQYKEVKKTRSGYGGINLFTGARAHPPRAARIAAVAGAFFLVLGLPIIVLATTKD